jgi:hypothetical protein
MVKLKHEPYVKNKKMTGPCVVVIHAEWCGHCKDFMPIYKNEIVPSNNFDEELKDLLTLSSVEDKEYLNAKDLFGEIDGYPTVRYITFDESGKPLKDNNGAIMKIDAAANIPRKAKDITEWINTVVKRDVNKKKHKRGHNSKHAHDMRGGSKKAKRSKRVVKRTKRVLKRSKRSKRTKRVKK